MFAKYCNKELTEPLFGHLLQPPIFLPENMNKIQNYLFKESKARRKERKKPTQLGPPEEKKAVFKHLSETIRKKQVPGKMECERCIQKSKPALDQREWTAVKYFVKIVIARAERLTRKGHQRESVALLRERVGDTVLTINTGGCKT